MRLHPAMTANERKVIPFRTATMSTQIVAQVREALFAKELARAISSAPRKISPRASA